MIIFYIYYLGKTMDTFRLCEKKIRRMKKKKKINKNKNKNKNKVPHV